MAPRIIAAPTEGRDRTQQPNVLWKVCCFRAHSLSLARIFRSVRGWNAGPALLKSPNGVIKEGGLVAIFEAMSDDPDFEYLIVESTIVRVHQHAAGAKRGSEDHVDRPLAAGRLSTNTYGRSRLGMPRAVHVWTAARRADAPQAAA